MDYATLINNFIDRKIMRGNSIPERSYGNMKYRNDILYSYSNPLVVRQRDTGIYFLNSDMVSNTTGRHIRHAIWSFRSAKVPLIEVSGGALESILGYRNWSWSGRYFSDAVNNIELIESSFLENQVARQPENCLYEFSKKINGTMITKYYDVNGELVERKSNVGAWFSNGDIKLMCTRARRWNTHKRLATMKFDSIPAIEKLIEELEPQEWEYEHALYNHKSSAIVFRSKYRQFESLFDGDVGYGNEIEHKKWYYYYGGFDERQYFIAALPREVNGIEDALESLKPEQVITCERTWTVGMREVLRQGEWFFVPAEFKIFKNRFKNGALPDDGEKSNSHVCKHYVADGNIYVQDTTVYHRNGKRSTGEHKALKLKGQYMAFKNTELDSRSSMGKVD